MNHLFKRFRRDIIGLIWLSIGIFLGLALYSYNPLDPSFNSVGESLSVQNYCGYFGSFLSDLFYQILGLASWVFVLSALRLSFYGFSGRETSIGRLRFLWVGLLILTCSSLSTLYFPELKFFNNTILVGGSLGYLLTTGLVSAFNFAGVAVILWTLAAVLIVFYTERTLSDLFFLPWRMLKKGYYFLVDHWYSEKIDIIKRKVGKMFSSIFRMSPRPALQAVAAPSANFELKTPMSGNFFRIQKETREESDCFESSEIEEGALPEVAAETKEKFFGFKNFKIDKGGKKRKVSAKHRIQRHIENWELPSLSVLEDPPAARYKVDDKELRQKADLLVNKLEQFSVHGKVVGISPGPAVTMFEFKPNVEVKISNITKLADDLSLALSSESIRIIAPIPGRDVVGIESSNTKRETVFLKDIIAEEDFWDEEVKLPLALGRQADGTAKVVDLRKMPHLLVAGSTGSGKSVFTVSTITGLIMRHSPKTLKLILIDPKQVDLAAFNEIPHLLMPPIRDTKKAVGALKWAIKEMEKRYRSMSKFGARGIEDFNAKVAQLNVSQVGEHEEINENLQGAEKLEDYYYTEQPYIVIVVEEFADIMVVDKNNVEQAVVRLAQMARASGIHLVLAMQSPRKDVVTGLIKTNIPGRISFKVASRTDSRIILDDSGAERLLSRGDMLFLAPGVSKPGRHHGPWVSDDDINEITSFWRNQGQPQYEKLALRAIEGSGGGFDFPESSDNEDSEFDDKYDEILSYVSTVKEVSASLLQRRFRLGYPRAARLIEVFEEQGVVGPPKGSKPRQVLINELK